MDQITLSGCMLGCHRPLANKKKKSNGQHRGHDRSGNIMLNAMDQFYGFSFPKNQVANRLGRTTSPLLRRLQRDDGDHRNIGWSPLLFL